MKKAIILTAVLAVFILTAVACGGLPVAITDPVAVPAAQPASDGQTISAQPAAAEPVAVSAEAPIAEPVAAPAAQQSTGTEIDEEAAKKAAFEMAKLTPEQIAALKYLAVKADTENGKAVYEVDFVLGDTEYDFEIDRATGEVVSFDWDIETYGAEPRTPGASTGTGIDEEAAKKAAFEMANLTPEQIAALKYLVVRTDTENGKTVYEVDFVLGDTEYDFEIDRATGAVVSFDREIETYGTEPRTPDAYTGTDIGEEAAKKAAFTEAWLTDADIAALKYLVVKTDWENGKPIYEVDFVLGNTEYDFEIDRATGSVLAWDQEIDDYGQTGFAPGTAPTGTDIGRDAAADVPLSRVPGATASDMRIHSDYDDGRLVYEGKIVYNDTEYEFEIDAATGKVLEWDSERAGNDHDDWYDDDDRYDDDDDDDDRYDDDDDDDDRYDDDDDD